MQETPNCEAKTYDHFEAWITNGIFKVHTKGQAKLPTEFFNIHHNEFTGKLFDFRKKLVEIHGTADRQSIYRICREYVQQIEKEAFATERKMQIEVEVQKIPEIVNGIPVEGIRFIQPYIEKDLNLQAEEIRKNLNIFLTPSSSIMINDVLKSVESMVKPWREQIDQAIEMINKAWEKIEKMYRSDKRHKISKYLDAYEQCKVKVSDLKGLLEAWTIGNTIDNAIDNTIKSIIKCVEGGPILSANLIQFYFVFRHEDHLDDSM